MANVKRKHIPWRSKQWNSTATFRQEDGSELTVRGRKYVVDGVELELFPSGALCKVMGRSQDCLYTWEHHHNFPMALWRLRDHPTINRWYSKKQLIAIHAIMEAFGWLRGKRRYELPQFIQAVRACFFTVDLPKEPQ